MQCPFCGTQLPATAQVCSLCGNAITNEAQGYDTPTQYSNVADINQSPTEAVNLADMNQPPTAYDSTTDINQPPPPPPYGYGAAPYQPPSSPYQPLQSGSGYPQQGQQSGSGYQPYPSQPGVPYSGNAPYPGQIPGYVPPQKKPRSRVGLFIGIGTLVLIVLCIGASVIASNVTGGGSHSSDTVITGITPTSTNQATPNDVSTTIDPQAAAIVINAQTVSKIDKNSYKPVQGSTTSTFKINKPIYVTFDLDPDKFNAASETDYINARFYVGSDVVLSGTPLQIGANNFNGYFSADYNNATTAGSVRLYWCHTSTCTDGELAQIVHFTVTN